MPTVVATGQMTLLDLNDAFVAGTQPSNPIEGMLWVDTSTTPSKLKIYKLGTWVPQTLSLIDLDPDYGAQKGKIDDLIDDAKLSHTERGDLATILYELIPVLPSTGTALSLAGTSADTAAELFAGATWQTGLVYQIRKAALDVGLLSSHASFVATKTKYNAMVTQLNLMKTASAPIIYGWEVSSTYKATFVPVANADAFRTALKELYQALNALATLTTDFVNDEAIYRASYGNQLVGNAYGDTGSNRNFSNFTYSSTEKVTGKGSFYRSVTNVVTSDEFIPVDPSRNYVLRIQTKGSTSTGKHVVGLLCYNAAGTNLGERYIVRDNANSYFLSYTTAWTSYRGRIGGLGGGTDVNSSMFPVGTVSVKIYFSTNLYTTTNVGYFTDIEFDVEKIESGVDYNGINLSGASGITVESSKNTLTMNATKGIEIIKKTDPSNPIFKVDSTTGDLNVKGNIVMTGGTISWANVGTPTPAQVGAATPGDIVSAVENVTVGGRNLLLDSAKQFSWNANNTGLGTPVLRTEETTNYYRMTADAGKTVSLYNTFRSGNFSEMPFPGEYYVLSVDARTPTAANLVFSDSQNNASQKTISIPANRWTRVQTLAYASPAGVTMVQPIIYSNTQFLDLRNVKYEKGNKMTDWTPAPEDAVNAIGNIKVGGRNLIQTSNLSYVSGTQIMDKSDFPTKGSLRLYVTAATDGARFVVPGVQPNTSYVMSYKYRKVSGTLTAFGGHTDTTWSTNTTTVDGIQRLNYSGETSVFVADDTNTHRVIVKFTTPSAVNGAHMIYIQPNRSNTTPVVMDIFDLQLEEGTNASDWSASIEDATQAAKDASQSSRNYYLQKSFGGSGCLASYDSVTKEWELAFNEGTSSWRGLRYNGLNAVINPGETVTISYEVYANVAVDMAVDINNYKVSTGVAGGNDNDDMTMRKVSPGTTVAGKWTKQVVQYTMGAVPEPYFDNTVICIANSYVAPAGFKIKIRKLQFQKGLVASEWMSASEEVDASVAKLEGMEIGGSNILDNSNFEVTFASGSVTSAHPDLYASGYGGYNGGVANATTAYHAHIDKTTFSFPVIEYNESNGNRTWKAATAQNIKVDSAGTYMFSFDAYATGAGTKLTGGFYYTKVAGSTASFYSGQMDVRSMPEGKWGRMSVEVKLNEDVDLSKSINFYMYGYDFTSNSILYIKNLQLEKGNKATTWSPSAYDTQKRMDAMRVALNSTGLLTVVDKDNIQTGKVKADFIDVKGLTVNNGTKNTFRVDSAGNVSVDGNINMTGGSISWGSIGAPSPAQVGAATPSDVSTAVTTGVNNIKVGGRNLLSNSGRLVSTTAYGMTNYPLAKTIAAGTQVTVSMKAVLGAGKRYFGLYNSGGNVQVATLGAAQLGADGIYRFTFNWAVGASSNVNLTVYHMDSTTTATSTIEWIKLEEGNKATDWTPAPEDIETEVNAFRTAAAATGLVTVIDQNTVQTGRVRADYLDVKGLTVNNGATDTFKIDAGGNATFNGTVTVNGASNVYSKGESQTMVTGVNNIGLGMKMNFGTFTTAATNKIYFHGFSYNDSSKAFVAADVNGFFYSYDNTTKVYPTKGVLDVSTGTPLTQGYVIYDTATARFYFIRFDVPTGKWYRYNAADSARHNQVFTFTSTMFIIADLDLAS